MAELKNIKVTDDVKAELDAVAFDKETYNVTIQRLMRENKRLAVENTRLYYDKQLLMKMLLKDDSLSISGDEFKFVPFIESVLFESDLSDADKVRNLKRYFTEVVSADKDIILKSILIVKDSCDVSGAALSEFESWIDENY